MRIKRTFLSICLIFLWALSIGAAAMNMSGCAANTAGIKALMDSNEALYLMTYEVGKFYAITNPDKAATAFAVCEGILNSENKLIKEQMAQGIYTYLQGVLASTPFEESVTKMAQEAGLDGKIDYAKIDSLARAFLHGVQGSVVK